MKKKKTVKKLTDSQRAMKSKNEKLNSGWVQKSFLVPEKSSKRLASISKRLAETERHSLVRAIDLLFELTN